jgi:hypothetical protein
MADSSRGTYFVWGWVITESDISVDSEYLYFSLINKTHTYKLLQDVSHTKSLAGNSGIVSSFSIIFSVRDSTNVSQSFFEAL